MKILVIQCSDFAQGEIENFVKELQALTAKKKYNDWVITVTGKKYDTFKLDADAMDTLRKNAKNSNS